MCGCDNDDPRRCSRADDEDAICACGCHRRWLDRVLFPESIRLVRPAFWTPGEVYAMQLTIAHAELYGYGNLIGFLRRAWALKLMASNPDLNYERAVMATNVDAYPQEVPPW